MADQAQNINTNVVLTADTSDYSSKMLGAQRDTLSTQAAIDKLLNTLDRLSKMAGRGLQVISGGTVASLTAAGIAAGKFEQQISSLRATAAITDRSIQGVVNQVNTLRTSLPLTTDQVVELINSLQKMGVNPNNIEQQVRIYTKLAAATGESVSSMATGMTQLQNQMGTLPGSTKKFADLLAGLSANMGVSAQGTLDFANTLAPVARTVGMTQQQLMGFSAAFAKSGQDGFAASTVMTRLMADISRASRYGTNDLEMFANVANMTTESFKKMGSADQIVKLFTELNRSGPDAIKVLDRMGYDGPRAQRAIAGVMQSGQIEKALQEAGLQFGSGATDKGAKEAMTGMAESSQMLKNSLTTLATEIGGPLVGAFTKILDVGTAVTKTFAGMVGPISGVINAIGAVAAPVAGTVGTMMQFMGPLTTVAMGYGLLKSPLVAGLMSGAGRSGAMGGAFSKSIESLQAGRGGPLQTMLFGLGGRAGGLFNRESWSSRINSIPGIDDLRTARSGAASALRDLFGRGNKLDSMAPPVPRGGLGPRLAMLAANTYGNVLGFGRAGLSALTAGDDITMRRMNLDMPSRSDWLKHPIQSFQTATHATPRFGTEGSFTSVFTGRKNGEALAFSHAMKEATRATMTFGGQLLTTAGNIGKSAIGGIGKLGGGMINGLFGSPWGLALMAGMAGIGYISDERSKGQEQRERMAANDLMTNGYNQYAAELGLAGRAVSEFSTAVNAAREEINNSNGRIVTNQLTAQAQSAGYSPTLKKLAGMDVEQATAFTESIYSQRSSDAAITRSATTDLIARFGPDVAQQIINSASQGGTNPMVMYSGNARGFTVGGLWRATAGQSESMNDLVVPAMASQRDVAQNLYGVGSKEVSQVVLRNVQELLGGMRDASGQGERDLFVDSLARYLGVDTKDLELSGSDRARIAGTGSNSEAFRTLFQALEGTSVGDQLARAATQVDPSLLRAPSRTSSGQGLAGATVGSQWLSSPVWMSAQVPQGTNASAGTAESDVAMPDLGYYNPNGTYSAGYRRRLSALMNTAVGSGFGRDIFTGENENVYTSFGQNLGNAGITYNAAQTLLGDVAGIQGISVSSATSASDLQQVVNSLQSFKQAIGDSTDDTYKLAQAAQSAAQNLMQIKLGTMNMFERYQSARQGQISAYRADPKSEGYAENAAAAEQTMAQANAELENYLTAVYKARKDFDANQAIAERNRNQQMAWAEEDFNRQRSQSYADFYRNRQRGEEDYARSRSYALQDFDQQRAWSMADYYQSLQRNEEDYALQRKRQDTDYNKSKSHANEDFNRGRTRQEEDFAHQQVLMARATARQIQDVYTRMTTQRTWDAQNLLVNMGDQQKRMQEQQGNLTKLRGMGLSGDAISMMGLNEFSNQAQVARLVSDVANDPNLIKQLNESIAGRIDISKMFAFDPDSESWKEMQRAFELSTSRSTEDFQRSMDRNDEAFRLSVSRQEEDKAKSLERSEADFNKSLQRNDENFKKSMARMDEQHSIMLDRSGDDFAIFMARNEDEWARSLARNNIVWEQQLKDSEAALARSFEIVTATFEEKSEVAMKTLTGTTQSMVAAMVAGFGLQRQEIVKYATQLGDDFYKIFGPLFGGENNLRQMIQSGAFGNTAVRLFSDSNGPAGTSGNVFGRGGPSTDTLPDDSALYDRILSSKVLGGSGATTSVNNMSFAGGGVNPLQGASYRITSRFGMRTNPVTGRRELHNGTDMAAPIGTQIKSYAPGIVTLAGWSGTGGQVVQVNHGDGWITRYHHMSRILSQVGQTVRGGDVIGLVGSTGNSTGPHLHFTVKKDGLAIDSLPFLTGASNVPGGMFSGAINMMQKPSKAQLFQAMVQSQPAKDIENALLEGPLNAYNKRGHFSLALGKYWADSYNPGFPDNSMQSTEWFAQGGVFNKARKIGVGEAGPEAVIPLSGRGADFMSEVLSRFSVKGADKVRANGRAVEVQSITYYQNIDNGAHFHGNFSAYADDPNKLVRALERKARLSRLERTHR